MAAGNIQDKKPNTKLAMALPLVCGVPLCRVTGGDETAAEGGAGEVSGRPQEGQNWLVSALEAPHVPQKHSTPPEGALLNHRAGCVRRGGGIVVDLA